MAEELPHGLSDLISRAGLKIGNAILSVTGNAVTTTSLPLFSDSSGNLNAAGFPFVVPFLAGVTNTANSFMSVEGFSTGTAAATLTQTLVSGTLISLTTAGFLRVTITDDGGNITNGQYYIPFGTLA